MDGSYEIIQITFEPSTTTKTVKYSKLWKYPVKSAAKDKSNPRKSPSEYRKL